MLHSVNASLLASAKSSKQIHCLAFSNASEGRSINIIAGGLSNGTIRFWSSWDLSVVRDISWDKFTKPIIRYVSAYHLFSLTFQLIMSLIDQIIVCQSKK